jgi:hypothetical protein
VIRSHDDPIIVGLFADALRAADIGDLLASLNALEQVDDLFF